MTELILFGVILALVLYVGYSDTQNRRERAKFTNALLAKSAQELRDLELTEKLQVKVEKPNVPNIMQESELTDEEWNKMVSEHAN